MSKEKYIDIIDALIKAGLTQDQANTMFPVGFDEGGDVGGGYGAADGVGSSGFGSTGSFGSSDTGGGLSAADAAAAGAGSMSATDAADSSDASNASTNSTTNADLAEMGKAEVDAIADASSALAANTAGCILRTWFQYVGDAAFTHPMQFAFG